MGKLMQIPKICIWCGANFIAQKETTQYCSHICNKRAYKNKLRREKLKQKDEEAKEMSKPPIIQKTKNAQESNPSVNKQTIIKEKEFLSVLEVSILMGVTRNTINKYCASGKLKCLKMNRKIFIRRKDLDELFEYAPPYKVTPKTSMIEKEKTRIKRPKKAITKPKQHLISEREELQKKELITDFYTAEEIAQKYGVTKGAVHNRAASNSIPKIAISRGKHLYSKPHIDKLYENDPLADSTITEWYSISDIKSRYGMSQTAVYTFVSEHDIPRKNNKGKMMYSQSHIDELLKIRLGDTNISEWYTMEDVYDKYGLQPNYIANFVFVNKIPKKRTNGKAHYSKEHFDKAVIERNPPTVYITIEDAAECFSMGKEEIHRLVIKHNIPKIKDSKLIRIQKTALELIINPSKLY